MAKVLNIYEMLEVLEKIGSSHRAAIYRQRLTSLASRMADDIAYRLHVDSGLADTAEGQTTISFSPIDIDDGVPMVLATYDPTADWTPMGM